MNNHHESCGICHTSGPCKHSKTWWTGRAKREGEGAVSAGLRFNQEEKVIILQARCDRYRAALERTADDLRAELAQEKEVSALLVQDVNDAEELMLKYRDELAAVRESKRRTEVTILANWHCDEELWKAEVDELKAKLADLQAVVDAARAWLSKKHGEEDWKEYGDMVKALKKLDAVDGSGT